MNLLEKGEKKSCHDTHKCFLMTTKSHKINTRNINQKTCRVFLLMLIEFKIKAKYCPVPPPIAS